MVLHVTMHMVKAKVSIENNMNHLDELILVVVELKINVRKSWPLLLTLASS